MTPGSQGGDNTITWNELVAEAEARITAAGIEEPAVSARWIAREATGTDASDWIEVADQPATERRLLSFDRMVARRCEGEPLQYVVGSWGFRKLDLFIDRRVLIPRPETEIITEAALVEFDRLLDGRRPDGVDAPTVVDLGTGSGAIGLSVAFERPGADVWLTDANRDALAVARANLAGIGRAGGAVKLVAGHWFDALPSELAGAVGVIVSNPPYVAAVDDLEPQVRDWEPLSALVADRAGTADLETIIKLAGRWLSPVGALVLEMAPEQVEPMVALASGHFATVSTVTDLTGRLRGLVARV